MIKKIDKNEDRKIRHERVRIKITGTADRPRLCVFRSLTSIYAQIIDDVAGHTIVSAGCQDKDVIAKVKNKTKSETAKIVGQIVAQKAKAKKITNIVFDRGGYIYTGRVKALAEGAREAGLKF